VLPIGLLFRDPARPRYDEISSVGLEMTVEDKLQALEKELDRFTI
jgi:hypothetical protein